MSLKLVVSNPARDCEDVVYELLSNGVKLTVADLEARCGKLAYDFTKEVFHKVLEALIETKAISNTLDAYDCITYLK